MPVDCRECQHFVPDMNLCLIQFRQPGSGRLMQEPIYDWRGQISNYAHCCIANESGNCGLFKLKETDPPGFWCSFFRALFSR
jgi:hypothetical protein